VDVSQSDSATELACINQSAFSGLVAIRWASWAPGSFLCFGAKNAVVRVYNASQQEPIDQIKYVCDVRNCLAILLQHYHTMLLSIIERMLTNAVQCSITKARYCCLVGNVALSNSIHLYCFKQSFCHKVHMLFDVDSNLLRCCCSMSLHEQSW
jgi:hypothetical protein